MAERRNLYSSSRFPGLFITTMVFTNTKLGRGADATVYEVDWNGTVCAAKRLHDALLEDEWPGGADKLISNFEAECLTWSKLRHPGVVQFLGVYLEGKSRLPVLVMEKMDTSLRRYLESHSKEEFPLHQKVFVLRQVTQALAYLHSQNPPLVHHDLSTNNVLLNMVSFVTKVSDFGMSRAINPSALSRKSSIKGTQAFMPPEALKKVPKYDTKLDVFSFGNMVISTLTHEWPDPEAPTKYEGGQLIGLSELQRREYCTELFTAQEKQLFLHTVRRCLENRPDKRPSSVELVQELRHIESTLPRGGHVAAPIEHLHRQLSVKEEECREKDKELSEKDRALREKDEVIQSKVDVITGKDEALWRLDEVIRENDEALRVKDVIISNLQAENRRLISQVGGANEDGRGIAEPVKCVHLGKPPPRDWRTLGECQKVIKHSPEGGQYGVVAVNSEGLLAVTDRMNGCVHFFTKDGALVKSIGEGVLGGILSSVAFDLNRNIWVSDWASNTVVQVSQEVQLLRTICHAGKQLFYHPCVSVSPEGLIYVCDYNNHRVTVHDPEGKFLFAFGKHGSGPGSFDKPRNITFGSDGLLYITDNGNKLVCVWSKDGVYKREFKPKYSPSYIAATCDDHLLITSCISNIAMVYTLGGELVHEFGGPGSDPGKFNGPLGVCVDNGLVYVTEFWNQRMQVF